MQRVTDFPLSRSDEGAEAEGFGMFSDAEDSVPSKPIGDADFYDVALDATIESSESEVDEGRRWAPSKWHVPEELSAFLRWIAKVVATLATAGFWGAEFLAGSVAVYVRRHPVHCFANVALLTTIGLLLATGVRVNGELIDEKLSDRTVSDLVAASQYTRGYSLAELEERGEREFMRVGAPDWVQRESVRAILEAARAADLSLKHQAVLLATAEIESGFNPMATAATTTACGVFQFIRSTGAKFGLEASACLGPRESSKAAVAHYMSNYKQRIEDRVEKLSGPEKLLRMFELSYYLHHDGPLSSDPSDELKATVLAATPYLFRAHEIIEREREARTEEPTFLDKLELELANVVATFKAHGGWLLAPLQSGEGKRGSA